MRGPNDPAVREPVVAGRFYPADAEQCRLEAKSFLKPNAEAAGKRWIGAIIPHAGWMCSGAVAGQGIATLAGQGEVDVVVVFGAVHTRLMVRYGALDSHQRWWLPSGEARIAQELHQRLLDRGNLFLVDERLHTREHSIEVNIPLIQMAFPGAAVLPIEIPPVDAAELMGRKTAQSMQEAGVRAVYLASTDLTHYGADDYGFAPAGAGPAAMEWVKENDRRLLRLIEKLEAEKVVPEAQQHHSACGAGAIAALLGACKQLGATEARVLWHTNSYETLAKVEPQPPTRAVGYAAAVVG